MNLPTKMALPTVNSHNSWSPLEEVWLGDVYPVEWYEHLQPEVRDIFQRLTEITKQDLTVIQNKLTDLGITVQRPRYENIDDFLIDNDNLRKPSICPRDVYLVVGNTLYVPGHGFTKAWDHTFARYRADSSVVRNEINHIINGANVVRVGKDIIIDSWTGKTNAWQYDGRWPEYRVKMTYNGGHMDGCFSILKPGLILANHYWDEYDEIFPGWEVIRLDEPRFNASPSTGYKQPYPVYNGKFWDTTVGTTKSFNEHIVNHALDWVGCYTETFFELNCLVIDPCNVIMLAENEILAKELERHGISVHWVPFRTRSFWDGAMHCLTVDIRRQSEIEDFFPERNQ